MGPEGGDRGGTVIAKGTPEEIVKVKKSYTGYYEKDAGEGQETTITIQPPIRKTLFHGSLILNSYQILRITLYENGKNSVII